MAGKRLQVNYIFFGVLLCAGLANAQFLYLIPYYPTYSGNALTPGGSSITAGSQAPSVLEKDKSKGSLNPPVQVAKVKNLPDMIIAFSGRGLEGEVQLPGPSRAIPVPLKSIELNEGGSLDISTSTFYVPLDGLYYLNACVLYSLKSPDQTSVKLILSKRSATPGGPPERLQESSIDLTDLTAAQQKGTLCASKVAVLKGGDEVQLMAEGTGNLLADSVTLGGGRLYPVDPQGLRSTSFEGHIIFSL